MSPLNSPPGDDDGSEAARSPTVRVEKTLSSFGLIVKIGNVISGPALNVVEVVPAPDVKVSDIVGRRTDLEVALGTLAYCLQNS